MAVAVQKQARICHAQGSAGWAVPVPEPYPGLQHELERKIILEFSGKYHCAQPLVRWEIDGLSSQFVPDWALQRRYVG